MKKKEGIRERIFVCMRKTDRQKEEELQKVS
jgi:hypothetical protein